MNRTVNLTKRVQTSRGLRYCPVVLAANGRVRADLVIIRGQEERHPEGAYYLGGFRMQCSWKSQHSTFLFAAPLRYRRTG